MARISAPPEEMFAEIKTAAIRMLKKQDRLDSLKYVEGLENKGGNFVKIINVFDGADQVALLTKIRRGTAQMVMEVIG